MRDQVRTRQTTVFDVMAQAAFALGVADARAGKPFRPDYETWKGGKQWSYERGRQWAQLAPRTVVLKRGGRITSEAVHWFLDGVL
jgi:hypothetical protein